MIESYEVGVSLVMDNRILASIAKANSALLELQNTIMGANAALNRMNRLTREAAAAASGLAAAWKGVADSVRKAQSNMGRGFGGGGGGGGFGGAASAGGGSFKALGYSSVPALAFGGGGGGGGGGLVPYTGAPGDGRLPINLPSPQSGSPRDYARAALTGGISADIGFHFLKDVFTQAASVDAIKSYMLASGFSPAQAAAAYNEANKVREQVPGSSLSGNLGLIADLKSVFASPADAMKYMPEILKQAIVAQNNGYGVSYDQAFSAARAGELSAALNNTATGQLDPVKFVKFMNAIANVSLLTSGRVGPHDYVAMAQNAGPAVMAQLSNQALFQDLPALILGLGGSRAGTALNALATQFKGGKMSQYAARAMHDIGLLPDYMFGKDGKILKHYRYGIGIAVIDKGTLPRSGLYNSNPIAWFNEVVVPHLVAHGYTTQAQQENYLYRMMSRTPGIRVSQDMIANLLLIKKYEDMISGQAGKNSYQTVVDNNPQLQAGALGQSWNAFLAALGNTAMPQAIKALNGLTDDLNAFGDWAQKHQGESKQLLDFAAGLTAVSAAVAVGSVLALALTPGGWFILGVTALGTILWDLPDAFKDIEKQAKKLFDFLGFGAASPAPEGRRWRVTGRGGGWVPNDESASATVKLDPSSVHAIAHAIKTGLTGAVVNGQARPRGKIGTNPLTSFPGTAGLPAQ